MTKVLFWCAECPELEVADKPDGGEPRRMPCPRCGATASYLSIDDGIWDSADARRFGTLRARRLRQELPV